MMIQVDAPHHTAGLILENDVCVSAAPILRWAVGKDRAYLSRYFQRRGWKVTIVERDHP